MLYYVGEFQFDAYTLLGVGWPALSSRQSFVYTPLKEGYTFLLDYVAYTLVFYIPIGLENKLFINLSLNGFIGMGIYDLI